MRVPIKDGLSPFRSVLMHPRILSPRKLTVSFRRAMKMDKGDSQTIPIGLAGSGCGVRIIAPAVDGKERARHFTPRRDGAALGGMQ